VQRGEVFVFNTSRFDASSNFSINSKEELMTKQIETDAFCVTASEDGSVFVEFRVTGLARPSYSLIQRFNEPSVCFQLTPEEVTLLNGLLKESIEP
jgi:hypothetical protein